MGCGTHNWLERAHCRSCSNAKGTKREKQVQKPEAKKLDETEGEKRPLEKRPLASEERAKLESDKAHALEASAATLRKAGLEDQAKELETAAAQHRKAAKEPAPGKRLDDLEGFVQRCEKRGATRKAG